MGNKPKQIKQKYIILILVQAILSVWLLAACGSSGSSPHSSQSETTKTIERYEEPKTITLSDDDIAYSGSGIAVTESTVTIIEGGGYILAGTLSDGKIIIDTDEDILLTLNGIDITSAKSSAISFVNTGKAVIEIADGTENRISDGQEKVKKKDMTGDTDAVLYSNSDIELHGDGALYIKGNNRAGIYSNTKVEIYSGILHISAKNQGVFAQRRLTVNGGEIYIEQSKEGMESKGELTINGGQMRITAKDDALNASVNLVVNEGYIYADCGGDGFDSNGDMTINGGEIYIFAGIDKNSALDISDGDKIGRFTINGGIVVAAGGDMRIDIQKKSNQGYAWIYPQELYDGLTNVVSESGEIIIAVSFPKIYDLLFVSTENIESSVKYTLSFPGS